MIKNQFNEKDWKKIIDFIINYIDIYKNEKKINSTNSDFNRMMLSKTKEEYLKLCSSNKFFSKFCKYETVLLNNKPLLNFSLMWGEIEKKIKQIEKPDPFFSWRLMFQ